MASKETFFSKIEAWFKKVLGSEAEWERTASVTLSVAAPLVEEVVGLTAGEPTAAAIAAVVAEVQNDLAAANAVVTGAGSTPSLLGFLNSAKSNLNTLVSAAQIKDPTTQTKVEAAVNTVIGEIEAIIEVVPAAASTAA